MSNNYRLLFVDTNIWLDFYRARTEAGLTLLDHLEKVSGKIIASYHLEMEYKKNRQYAILEGMQELKQPANIPRLGIFSDAKATRAVQSNIKNASARIKYLKTRLSKVLSDPARYDPVYKACQRIFHADSQFILNRDDVLRRTIRRRAFRRFIHGCPPRKKNDLSLGDALNWEWMIECSHKINAELIIVSRDSDYGITFEDKAYINDHLKHEFAERVNRQKKIVLYTKLSDALKHFSIPISRAEEQEEDLLVQNPRRINLDTIQDIDLAEIFKDT
ncbi:PIN domain-containing protein [Chromobacterium subtsugae]|uniref:PIN domain-containing protein n=1 Tax=Chromobacterium subtsugae TaxID=251747 RepID=UPI00096FA24A|nr:PIN domain-containing protein [Chromobacterium subtsugae]